MTNKRWYRIAAMEILMALFAFTGLFTAISDLNFQKIVELNMPLAGVLQAVLLAGLVWLFDSYRKSQTRKISLWILSALCALTILLDRSFLLAGDWSLLFASAKQLGTSLWVWLGMTISFNAMLCLLADAVKRGMNHLPRSQAPAKRYGWLARLALYMGLLLLCWLPHIVLQMPGHIETTAGQQIRISFGELPLTKDNPLFHTLWIKLVMKGTIALGLGDTAAVFALSLSQLLPLAAALAWTLLILERRALPAVWIKALACFYALCPLFPLYGLFIVKDVPFAVAVLLLICVTTEIVYRRETFWQSPLRCMLWIGIGAAVCLLRNVAVVVYVVVVIAILLFVRMKGVALKRFLLCSAAALILFGGFTLGVNGLLKVGTLETRRAENKSIQCQIVARVVKYHKAELSNEELAAIDACIPLDGLESRYNPEVSDPVKDTWRTSVTAEQNRAFDGIALALAARYPAQAAQAVLRMGIPYLTPGDPGRFRAIFDYGFSNIETLYPTFAPKHLFSSAVFRAMPDFFQHQPLIQFFCSGGIYAWLLLGSVVLLQPRRRMGLLPCWLPALLVLAGCLFSPVAGYVRYALPYMFAAPFLLLLMLGARQEAPETAVAQSAAAVSEQAA